MYKSNYEQYDYLIKLLLLGDSAVGKSSLLLRFCENKFENSFVLTIGVDFKSKIIELNGKKLKLQVWDTAGQERFRTITPAYFRSAMGVILVYDITNIETFNNLSYWMKNLEEYANINVQKILVGNKCDLNSQRQVSEQRGKELAQEYKIPFFETSAKLDSSVTEAFSCIAEEIKQKFFSDMNKLNISVGNNLDISQYQNNTTDIIRQKSLRCCNN
ncbi:Ras family protein SEC4, putative [Cryptosporidium muris RN66]|uniref:Ras-related protein Rab-1 n=1 Tax=Cryptosporidium muris (strain RN66) TaxID=441375 RepID=B6AJF6_CRYMR|nr:Ras family protein SEC4, putative [Cryptosporidium muris RN66]EEA08347.1 Ras family protein SEC4, putative [Cryptosporidium muris RN66]|eukprot:XP_002142696.1 Ras family protein SEC4 [Cryptosporidium muris RN66]